MTQTMRKETAAASRMMNGVNLDALMATVTAIKGEPELGACRFRASNTWLAGNHNRSTVKGFYGAKQEMVHRQTFTMDADEPAILAGNDDGANPVEHLLHALASCLTTSMVAHAAVRGIRIESLESELEGDLDLNGFLGLDESVPKGYTAIRAKFRVKCDPKDRERVRELAQFSPVFNTLTRGTEVSLTVEGP
ncbi:MAG: OsmC family protein [Steroidobacteraceae bacterium]|nr:OsmC family protein [Steroidobacteraceae bacterium]